MNMSKKASWLTRDQLHRLATQIASACGMKAPSLSEISTQYDQRTPLPFICGNDHWQMWVDQYYLAIQHNDEALRYIYLTKHHIDEERASYRSAAKERANPDIRLPTDISDQFDKASEIMQKSRTRFWIDKRFDQRTEAA